MLHGGPLCSLWAAADTHRLPRPAAYSGPQVALRLLPSPCRRQLPQQQQEHQQSVLLKPQQADGPELLQFQQLEQQQQQLWEQQQQQQQQQPPQQEEGQSAELCVLVPTAPLLAELLLVLMHRCQAHLQQQQQQQQLQLPPAALPPGAAFRSSLQEHQLVSTTFLRLNMRFVTTLLVCSLVPPPCAPTAADFQLPSARSFMAAADTASVDAAAAAYDGTAASLQHLSTDLRAAAAAQQQQPLRQSLRHDGSSGSSGSSSGSNGGAAAEPAVTNAGWAASSAPSIPASAAAAAAAAAGHPASQVNYSCVLHAQDVLMQHARDIISICEATLRSAAADCDVETVVAVPTPAADGGSSNGAAAAATALAHDSLDGCTALLFDLCCPSTLQGYPCYPCPLALLTLIAGPGSQVQHQLHSLLATMVKLSGQDTLRFSARSSLYAAAGFTASSLLAGAAKQQHQQQQGLVGAAAVGTCGSSTRAGAVAALPAVVILGRCLMQEPEMRTLGALSLQQQQSSSQQEQQEREVVPRVLETPALLSGVQHWLQAGSTCKQLTAAGYAPLPVLEQLQQLLATCKAIQDSPPDAAIVQVEAQQLQSTGVALCSFAVPCMCNNPGCTHMGGLSELAAVSGRSCICGGCLVARYCGRACQRAAWKQHKPVCAVLSAAASTGGTGAGAPLAAEPAAQGSSS